MVGAVDDDELGAGQWAQHRLEQIETGEVVARALQEEHGQVDAAEVIGARVAGLPGGCSGKPRKTSPRTPGSGSADCACDVMRPPIDLPPARRGRSGARRAASATAARTVASSSGGRSGIRRPASMYGNW